MAPLNDALLMALELTIRRALRYDPAALRRLQRMDGKIIEVRVSRPSLQLFILPNADGLDLSSRPPAEPDCRIEGGAADFVELLLDEQKSFGSGIRLSGDTELAIDLNRCLQQLDIDWEGMLAERIGDLPGHQLSQWLRQGYGYLRGSTDSLLDDLDDYLHEEVRLLPPQPELEQFYDQVDQLRLQVDRP